MLAGVGGWDECGGMIIGREGLHVPLDVRARENGETTVGILLPSLRGLSVPREMADGVWGVVVDAGIKLWGREAAAGIILKQS